MKVQRYVPILKASEGEFRALEQLAPRVVDKVEPLFEIQPRPTPRPTRQIPTPVARTPEAHLGIAVRHLRQRWHGAAFIDTTPIGMAERMEDGAHPLAFMSAQLASAPCTLVPVLRASSDSAHRLAARAAAAAASRACIRLEPGDFDEGLRSTVDSLLGDLDLPAELVDVIVDSGGLPAIVGIGQHAQDVGLLVAKVPYIKHWRTFAVTATSFPASISDVTGVTTLPRKEWHAWRLLASRSIVRLPDFGDYGVAGPGVVNTAFAARANIRYTAENSYVIARAHPSGGAAPQTTRDLARLLVARPEFKGPAFSSGDAAISVCARGGAPGNAMKWRQHGTNHHITLVVS